MAAVQIKDFAYPDTHPRHFGLEAASEDEEDDDLENEDYSESENDSSLAYEIEDSDEANKDNEESDDEEDTMLVRAIALYPFEPENGNELRLGPNQLIYVNDSRDFGGWLVAYNVETGATGLVPSQYVRILTDENLDDDTLLQVENITLE